MKPNLNLGHPLTREELMKITAGSGDICDVGQPIACICIDGYNFPEVGDGVNTAPDICAATGVCAYHDGDSVRSNCQPA